VGGVGGNVNNLFLLGQELGRTRPVIGFQTRGVMGHRPHGSIEEMAADNIRYMRAHQPEGPYVLAGYSGGALTAHEMVRQLEGAGERVTRLVILDTFAPGFADDFVPKVKIGLLWRLRHEAMLLRRDGLPLLASRLEAKIRFKLARGPLRGLVKRFSLSHYRFEVMRDQWTAAARGYRGGPIAAPVTLLKTEPVTPVERLAFEADRTLGWKDVVPPGRVEIVMTRGDHRTMLEAPHVTGTAAQVARALSAPERP
jgi:thioesterase domain-containing protein